MRYLIFLSLLFYFSCSNPNNQAKTHATAIGSVAYGGCLKLSMTDNYQTLYPPEISDANSALISHQIYDGLIKLNINTLEPEPCLAEKWEVDSFATKYVFHLKKGAYFQDDECYKEGKGREIKASDVKFTFELLCTKNLHNQNFASTFKDKIIGANDFYEGIKKSVDGIKVVDDYTLEIDLLKPSAVFLSILAEPSCAILSKEAIDLYGKNSKTGGCGAFIFDALNSKKDKIVLKRNNNYHGKDKSGNQLPFLDSIVISLLSNKEKEFELFKKGEIDLISSLPSQSVKEIVEVNINQFKSKNASFILDNKPEMATEYYTFNTQKAPFNNVKVRKAFNLAINRKKLIDEVLNGQAYAAGAKGITPPTFTGKGYNINSLKGYDFNPKEAQKLLAEAGYPKGKNFPDTKILLNSGGLRNTSVVIEIQKQLNENLGINVDFDVVPFPYKLEQAKLGNMDIIRDSWIADYPSPESFLSLFYGVNVPADSQSPSFPNTSRYQNQQFDHYFNLGRDAKTKDSSMFYFMKAEQILMNDAPIMVLWYNGNYHLTHAKVKNAGSNAMLYQNFSETYIK